MEVDRVVPCLPSGGQARYRSSSAAGDGVESWAGGLVGALGLLLIHGLVSRSGRPVRSPVVWGVRVGLDVPGRDPPGRCCASRARQTWGMTTPTPLPRREPDTGCFNWAREVSTAGEPHDGGSARRGPSSARTPSGRLARRRRRGSDRPGHSGDSRRGGAECAGRDTLRETPRAAFRRPHREGGRVRRLALTSACKDAAVIYFAAAPPYQDWAALDASDAGGCDPSSSRGRGGVGVG